MSKFYDLTADLVRSIYDHRICAPAILDQQTYFPSAPRFTEKWQGIREEALAIGRDLGQVPRFHELLPEQREISAHDGRDWRMFVLKAYDRPCPANLARCPLVASLAAHSPDVLSLAFSYLAPGKHIPRHRGPFRGILRFTLSLSVPLDPHGTPATVLTVDDEEYRIRDGESLLWDDTYPHEVRNSSDQVRVALLMDVRRRGMPLDMAVLSSVLVGAIGTSMRFHHMMRTPGAP